ncbi:MAG TPA: hypothetical protein VN258_10170 [Mobilitalea sp.]|nr:hypothetical protein [Mobilitalea sp.]
MLKGNDLDYKYIYVAFLVTNTNMGKLIRLFTRNEYSHVTLAFNKELSRMYSFARYHVNSPISGGFVVELPDRYLLNNEDVMVKLCKLPVTEEEFKRIHQEIVYFHTNREEMLYNTPNAVLSLLRRRLHVKNAYTCLEFVTHLLRIPNVLAIRELESRLDQYVVYSGSFRDIVKWQQTFSDDNDYLIRRHVVMVVLDTVFHFKKIVVRLIRA